MSSILDALKKLESEKSENKDAAERAQIEAVAAERDLTRRRRSREDDEVIRINSTLLVLVGLGLATVLVTVSVVAALAVTRTMGSTQVTATPAPASIPASELQVAEAAPIASPPVATAPFQPVPVEAVPTMMPAPMPLEPVTADPILSGPAMVTEPVDEVVATDPMAVAAPEEPVVWVEPDPAPQAIPVVEEVLPESVAPPEPAPSVAEPPAAYTPQPPVATTPPPNYSDAPIGDIDLDTLPVLSESERVRLGLPRMKINIVGLPTKRQPRPSALINFEKVYLGEYIKNSNARLIAVELHGVGIEVAGHRYFMEK